MTFEIIIHFGHDLQRELGKDRSGDVEIFGDLGSWADLVKLLF